jgi:hypothetical protein
VVSGPSLMKVLTAAPPSVFVTVVVVDTMTVMMGMMLMLIRKKRRWEIRDRRFIARLCYLLSATPLQQPNSTLLSNPVIKESSGHEVATVISVSREHETCFLVTWTERDRYEGLP